MTTFLNVRVLDVNYAPMSVDKAQAMFNNQSYIDMPEGQETGTYTLQVQDDVQGIVVQVSKKTFFDATQRLVLKRHPDKPVPSLEYLDNKQEINIRNLRVTRLGSDVHLDVFVVLGQLADVTRRVHEEALNYKIDMGLKPEAVRKNGTPILNPEGIGKDVIRGPKVTVAPTGKLVFAERKTVPKLIAIYLPDVWCFPPNPYKEPEPGDNRTNYCVFFHPYVRWVDRYPYGDKYLDLVARYLLKSGENGGETLIHQQEVAQSQRVLVFPVGAQGTQMGTLNSQASMLRLLQEINYWAQRIDEVSYPIHTVGTCAISGFSGGIDFVSAIVRAGTGSDKSFYEDVLTDLYVFDGVSNTMSTNACCEIFRKWFQQGGRARSFRVYTQSQQWWNLLKDATPVPVGNPGEPPGSVEKPVLTMGPKNSNAKEVNTSASTILHCPSANLFQPLNAAFDYWWVHHYIPSRFLEHASAKSVVPG